MQAAAGQRQSLADKSLRAMERLLDSNQPKDFGPAGRAGIRVLDGLGQLETGKLAEVSKSTATQVSQSIFHINPRFARVTDDELVAYGISDDEITPCFEQLARELGIRG